MQGALGETSVVVLLHDDAGQMRSNGGRAVGQDKSEEYEVLVRLQAGRTPTAFRFRSSAPIVIQEGSGRLRRDDLVAPGDMRVYRDGMLATSGLGLVLTSLYQLPGVEEQVHSWFDEPPALTVDQTSSSVALSLLAKANVHGNLYMGFTLVDLTLPPSQALLNLGPNSTQFIFLRIVQVNTRPFFTVPADLSIAWLVGDAALHPVTLDGVVQNVTAGALDEDVAQRVRLEVSALSGSDGAGAACEELMDPRHPPAVSYPGFPTRAASISLRLQAERAGRCTLQLTASEIDGIPLAQALAYSANLTVVVASVNRAPSFALRRPELVVVANSGAHAIADLVGDISSGEPAAAHAPQQTVSMLVASIAATPPSLFRLAPSIAASTGLLSFSVSDGESGMALIGLRALDDGGTLFGGRDSSEEAQVRIQVLPRPRVSSVYPTWWMSTEVDAANLRLRVLGEFFTAARAGSELPPAVAGDQMHLAQPSPGAYVLVGGHPCLRTELVSDTELHCIGVRPFARAAVINVRVVEPLPPSSQTPLVREGTLGETKELQRIELLVGGASDDGRGFVATAANSSFLTLHQWNVMPDRSVGPARGTTSLVGLGSRRL